jgi:hypothetical protein
VPEEGMWVEIGDLGKCRIVGVRSGGTFYHLRVQHGGKVIQRTYRPSAMKLSRD